ncbi:MAG: hypothetical protein COT16_00065 [Elusimicrobia bacterium CG08_land_8_20_14_0_20_44_26]|nr:MAG: hypothetical protein COT16_00065 [Elusimicrobia bacterium CG08_land_8_20_14_0_20_44_26]
MVRINLLPQEIEKKAIAKRRMLLAVALGCVVLVIFLGIYLLRVAKIKALKIDLKNITAELAKYDADLQKIKEIESEKAKLENKLSVINELIASRIDYPKLMEVLTMPEVLPANVRLMTLSAVSAGSVIKLSFSIEAADNYAVADFLSNLEKSPSFTEIKVAGFSAASSGSLTTLRTMAVNCDYIPKRDKL